MCRISVYMYCANDSEKMKKVLKLFPKHWLSVLLPQGVLVLKFDLGNVQNFNLFGIVDHELVVQ